ncbi:MAG: hypothetical protein NTZ40_10950 [Cyanobacteria bacterium]|nr:hypothetical protein [Cyanobacteriota bacterium]
MLPSHRPKPPPPRWLKRGGTVSTSIEGIGSPTNPVLLESEIPPAMAP